MTEQEKRFLAACIEEDGQFITAGGLTDLILLEERNRLLAEANKEGSKPITANRPTASAVERPSGVAPANGSEALTPPGVPQ